MRKNQCAVEISHIRTSRRNVKTLPEATHDLAQRELAMLPLRAARIEAGNLPSGGHAIVVIRNDSHVQGARALRNLRNLASTIFSSSDPVFGDLSIIVTFDARCLRESLRNPRG